MGWSRLEFDSPVSNWIEVGMILNNKEDVLEKRKKKTHYNGICVYLWREILKWGSDRIGNLPKKVLSSTSSAFDFFLLVFHTFQKFDCGHAEVPTSIKLIDTRIYSAKTYGVIDIFHHHPTLGFLN